MKYSVELDNIWLVNGFGQNIAEIYKFSDENYQWVKVFPTVATAKYQDARHPLTMLHGPMQWDMTGFLGFIASLCAMDEKIPLMLRGITAKNTYESLMLTRQMNTERLNDIMQFPKDDFERWARYHATFDRKET